MKYTRTDTTCCHIERSRDADKVILKSMFACGGERRVLEFARTDDNACHFERSREAKPDVIATRKLLAIIDVFSTTLELTGNTF